MTKPQTAEQINISAFEGLNVRYLDCVEAMDRMAKERDTLKAALRKGIGIMEDAKELKESHYRLADADPNNSANYCELVKWIAEAKKLV